ncbi:hypothetical protein D3C85_1561010 [compost metagenome]
MFIIVVDEAATGDNRHVAQCDVGADRLGQEQALALAIFRDQRDAVTNRIDRGANADNLRRRAQCNRAAVCQIRAEDQAQQLGAPCPDQP